MWFLLFQVNFISQYQEILGIRQLVFHQEEKSPLYDYGGLKTAPQKTLGNKLLVL